MTEQKLRHLMIVILGIVLVALCGFSGLFYTLSLDSTVNSVHGVTTIVLFLGMWTGACVLLMMSVFKRVGFYLLTLYEIGIWCCLIWLVRGLDSMIWTAVLALMPHAAYYIGLILLYRRNKRRGTSIPSVDETNHR